MALRSCSLALAALAGLADGVPLQEPITAEPPVALAAFGHMLAPNGLPHLIFVDQGSLLKGAPQQLLEPLGAPAEPVAPKSHKVTRRKRLHRCLNKVEMINANNQPFHQWLQGTLFGLCAWSAGPADGADAPRSVVGCHRAHELPPPINMVQATSCNGAAEGQHAIGHCDAASPLLCKQRKLLGALSKQRWQPRWGLKSTGVKQQELDAGNLAIVH